MSRQTIVEIAAGQIGNPDTDVIWRDVLATKDYQPKITKAWCGAFALRCLHQAGVALAIKWKWGLGFLEVNRLPKVKHPEPGDIAYYDQPFQHHAIVERVDGDTLHTIDGNQGPGLDRLTGKLGTTVRRVQRPLTKGIYYSIAGLLPKTEPAPPPVASTAEVQHALNSALAASSGSPSLAPLNGRLLVVGGELNEETAAALRWFQTDRGLPVTGVADSATLTALGLQ